MALFTIGYEREDLAHAGSPSSSRSPSTFWVMGGLGYLVTSLLLARHSSTRAEKQLAEKKKHAENRRLDEIRQLNPYY